MIDKKTLVVVAVCPEETKLRGDLIGDLRGTQAKVISICMEGLKDLGADREATVPQYENFAVMGILFIFIPQAVAFHKAINRCLNPDKPDDLQAWIDPEGEEFGTFSET